MSRGILAFLAGAGKGAMDQYKYQEEKDRRDKQDKMAQESHDITVREANRKEEDRRTLADAARPVTMLEGSGGALRPDSADNRDVGQPGEPGVAAGGLGAAYRVAGQDYTDAGSAQAAVDKANGTDAVAARQAAAYRSIGKPLEAQQLDTAVTQGKAAKFTLSKAEEDHVNEQFDKKLATITTPSQLATVLSGSPLAGGKEVTLSTTPDGKKFQLMVPGADGTLVKFGQEIGSDPKDIAKALTTYSQSMKMPERVTALQHLMTFEENQRQFAENKRLQERQIDEQGRHNQAIEGNAAATLGVHQGTLQLARDKYDTDLKNDPTRSLTAAEKLTVQGIDASVKAIDNAITTAQAQGQWDPKSPNAIDLMARLKNLQSKRDQVLEKYMPGAGAKPAYPGSAPAAAPTTPNGKIMKAAEGIPGGGSIQNGQFVQSNGNAAAGGLPKDALQAKYDEWQAAKSAWFRQKTPTSAAREKQLEAEYDQMLRTQQ